MYLMFLRAMVLIRWILSEKSNDNSILISSFIMLKLRKIWFQAKSIHLYLYCREKTNKIGFIEGRFSNEQRLQVSTIGIFIEGAWGFDWPITVIHVFDSLQTFQVMTTVQLMEHIYVWCWCAVCVNFVVLPFNS